MTSVYMGVAVKEKYSMTAAPRKQHFARGKLRVVKSGVCTNKMQIMTIVTS